MKKAFINDKPLIFENIYGEVKNDENFQILSESEFGITDVIEKANQVNNPGIIYLCARPDRAWNEFVSRYILMEAAGGVVKNSNEELLVIFRKKKWDLPKGKLDYAESPENAAIREVKEECGIKNLELGKLLMNTFHIYTEKNKFILKKTHWFYMMSTDSGELIPQQEEKIEEARWMSKEKILKKVYPKTYASIRDVFEKYFESSG